MDEKKKSRMLKEHSGIIKNYIHTNDRKNYIKDLLAYEKKYQTDIAADIYLDIGHYYLLEEEYNLSYRYLSEYEKMRRQNKDTQEETWLQMDIQFWFDMAQLQFREEKEEEALGYLRKCLQYPQIDIREVFEFYECIKQWEQFRSYVKNEVDVYELGRKKLEQMETAEKGLSMEEIRNLTDAGDLVMAYMAYLEEKCYYGDALWKLSQDEKMVYCIDSMNQEVHSGGFFHYYTSENIYVPDMEFIKQAFGKIHASKTLEIIEHTFLKFPDGKLPDNAYEREKAIKRHKICFDEEDEQFYNYPEPLEEQIAIFLKKHA